MLVAARLEMSRMHEELRSRTVIAQAQGVIMERLGLEAPHAYAYLERLSDCLECPVIEVAADVVLTRELPGISAARLQARCDAGWRRDESVQRIAASGPGGTNEPAPETLEAAHHQTCIGYGVAFACEPKSATGEPTGAQRRRPTTRSIGGVSAGQRRFSSVTE